MRPGPSFSALFVALLATNSAVAAEEQPSAYDRLVDEALAEFDAGHFEEALAAFEHAYRERPSARALRGAAKALFELRAYARCIATIDRSLASDVDPLTDALRADLESLRKRARRFVGEAALEIEPETATVVLDGEAVDGRATAPRLLDVGAHTVDVSAPDYQAQRRRFEVHGGETTRVMVHLDPVRAFVPPLTSLPSPPVGDDESRTGPLVLSALAIVASTGAVVGSSLWLVDRRGAVERCNEVAASGARCANADSISFQQDMALGTLVVSSAALALSGVALYLVLRSERGAQVTRAAWTW